MSKHSRNMMWSLVWIWLVALFCNVSKAAAPDWQVINYPNYTGVLARVKINGVPVHSEGSLLAAFHGEELRGVAEILGANPDDDIDGEYYFSLLFGSNQSGETGFTFKLWNSADDTVYDLDKTLDFDTNYPAKPEVYGGFTAAGFAPCIMNAIIPAPATYAVTVVNGTASKTEAEEGETVTITANAPANGHVFDKWTSDDVAVANAAASTTTFTMPAKAVTVTATYAVQNPTVQYTLSPDEAVAAGAQWRIDDGAWNDSGATVETTVGAHTISFKAVTGYTAPANQTVTLAAGDAKAGTATYAVQNPTVQYTLSPAEAVAAGAQWKIDDGAWNDSGATATTTVGTHTISFKAVTGYTAPANQTVTLAAGDAKTGTATYAVLNPTVQYTLFPAEAVASGAQWRIDDGSWNDSGATVTSTVGAHTISFKDVAGFDAPENQTVTLAAGDAKAGTATYAVLNPTVQYTLSPAEAVAAGAQWRIDDGAWNDSGATATSTVGAHTISFKEVAGFVTPENQTVTLSAGDVKTGTITYQEAAPSEYTLTVVKGTINGTTATTGRFTPGEIVTIAATLPSNQGLKIWTPDSDVEFIGSVLGNTTTIVMPTHDVTITASFIAKSSMQAVSVRSTTNAGDDTAQEPSSATAAATDKGKFTFTRTSSSGSLTVYFDIRGTATNGTDYKQISSSVTFASGKTSVECVIEPLFDETVEGDETVEVVLIPATPTQTYRGGTYTNATLTIKDPEFATVQYTLSPDEAVTAGAQWRIDDGDWNNSGDTVTTTAGSHVVSFKDVDGYTAPDSQTITLAANEAKTENAAYGISDGKYTLTIVKGTINGTSASSAQFVAGEEVTIAATLPTNQGLKIWTADKEIEFVGSVLGATTTIRMPAHDVTVTASFIAKSSMQAVAVRSTTNSDDDTAKEPSATDAADKGKFTFTRTSSSGSLTVYFDIRGTAANGVDYKTIPSSVTFASGKTSVECEIEPLFDGIDEGDETVQVVLVPATPTQTYRGGAVTDATVVIKDTPVPVVDNPTVRYTLSPAEAVAAGAQWKIDDGSWNDSGATVESTVGAHTISFKAVTGYTAPANQTITLAAGEAKTGTAAYTGVVQNPTVQYTLSPAEAVAAGAQWKIDNGAWNDSGATVESTVGAHTISFKAVTGYTAPANQTITLASGDAKTGTAAYTPVGGEMPYHPADCKTQDHFISGLEFLEYAGPVKAAALGNYEYTWDGADVLSFARKATRGNVVPRTRGGDFAIVRTVSSSMFMAESTVEVTLTFSGVDRMVSLFVGEGIPEGWTVLGDAAGSVVDGVLRVMWDSPDIPASYTYVIQAPAANLAASYVIASSGEDTACFADDETRAIPVEDTVLSNNYHPADSVSKDGRISGLEYLKYAGPVKAAALGNYEYTWDGSDVLSLRRKNATRGGAADDVAIARHVDLPAYEADGQVAVTLTIAGADDMVSLFVGERIPDGWSVVGDHAGNVKNGVLRMTWDAPNIPETVTYTLQAPAENLPASCKIASSTADTGCFTDRVRFLDAGETVLTNGALPKPAEWPRDMALYAPADGRNFRESDNLAVTFGWPSIQDADSYRLVVAAYDGTVVFDETIDETSVMVRGLERGFYIWNVTAVGDGCIAGTSEDFRFAVAPAVSVPIIVGATADGTAVRLAFDRLDAGYTDGVFTYQIVFYSLETRTMTSLERTAAVANGRAVIELGVATSNGYLYIRPVTSPESDFTELYVK